MDLFVTKTEITFHRHPIVAIRFDLSIAEKMEFMELQDTSGTEELNFTGTWHNDETEVAVTYNPSTDSAHIAIIQQHGLVEWTEFAVGNDLNNILAAVYIEYQAIPELTVVEEPILKYDSKFLKVYERNGYAYAERLCKDSVAFILYDPSKGKKKFAVIKEGKPPIGGGFHMMTAFGGSKDSDKPLDSIVEAEVLEEAGYKMDIRRNSRINRLGHVLVSTQMNQWCYLYIVNVKGIECTGRTTTDPRERSAEVKWLTKKELLHLQDWKAPTIYIKAKQQGLL